MLLVLTSLNQMLLNLNSSQFLPLDSLQSVPLTSAPINYFPKFKKPVLNLSRLTSVTETGFNIFDRPDKGRRFFGTRKIDRNVSEEKRARNEAEISTGTDRYVTVSKQSVDVRRSWMQ